MLENGVSTNLEQEQEQEQIDEQPPLSESFSFRISALTHPQEWKLIIANQAELTKTLHFIKTFHICTSMMMFWEESRSF